MEMIKKTRKIQMKRIESQEKRLVSFCKRRQGLFSKAETLHKLTGADIAIIIFNETGRLYSYASTSLQATLDRYLDTSTDPIDTAMESDETLADSGHQLFIPASTADWNGLGPTSPPTFDLPVFSDSDYQSFFSNSDSYGTGPSYLPPIEIAVKSCLGRIDQALTHSGDSDLQHLTALRTEAEEMRDRLLGQLTMDPQGMLGSSMACTLSF